MAGLDPLAGHPKYRKIRDLGEGSYGFVLLARDMHANQDVAIKFWQRGMFKPPVQLSKFAISDGSYDVVSEEHLAYVICHLVFATDKLVFQV